MALSSPLRLPSTPNTAHTATLQQSSVPTANTPFTPRKEFIRHERVVAAFSLLALSGSSLVRLYSFSDSVFAGLRALFDQHHLVSSIRQTPKHFVEFTLEGKPWANPKSIKTEKLLVDILAVILHFGYGFLSTVDYGREQDDRLALAFSKPFVRPPSPSPSGGSLVSLHQPVRSPFAVSFCSQTIMRVIGPPLHFTPAVLQAVRGAWPRGILSEEKVGDATYEFRLKGYKWFQEDTFANDSLRHILGLLSALDPHGFTLIASLSLANRSRVKDMWIFAGLADEGYYDSVPSTPTKTKPDPVMPMQPYPSLAKSHAPPLSLVPGYPPVGTGKQPSDPSTSRHVFGDPPNVIPPTRPKRSSPLLKARLSLLRRSSPKPFNPTLPSNYSEAEQPVSPEQSPRIPPNVIDMTGIGSGRRRFMDPRREPGPLYFPNRPNNPSSGGAPVHSYPKAGRLSDILDIPLDGAIMGENSRRSLQRIDTAKPDQGRLHAERVSTLSTSARSDSQPPAVTTTPDSFSVRNSGSSKGKAKEKIDASSTEITQDSPTETSTRSSTPPLLSPGIFRDSTFSSSTTDRQSYDISTTWPGRNTGRDESRPRDRGDNRRGSRQNSQPYLPTVPDRSEDGSGVGPSLPGSWTVAPQGDDAGLGDAGVLPLPPTIEEEPNEGQDDVGASAMAAMVKQNHLPTADMLKTVSPSISSGRISPGAEGVRKSEAAFVGVVSSASSGTVIGSSKSARVSPPQTEKKEQRPPAVKRFSASGWVMVNVEGRERGKSGTNNQDKREKTGGRSHAKAQSSSASSPTLSNGRPAPHQRSSSDSRVPKRGNATAGTKDKVVSPPTVPAAAKAIVMIDAIEAKEQKGTKSAFRRLWGRATGSTDVKHERMTSGTKSVPSHAGAGGTVGGGYGGNAMVRSR